MKRADQFRQQQPMTIPPNGRPDDGSQLGEISHGRLIAVPDRIKKSPESDETRVAIGSDVDIVKARQEGRKVAGNVGFSLTDSVLVATAISELARNIVRYARKGEIAIRPIANSSHRGIEII